MQVLHSREIASIVQDEFSGGTIPVIPDFAVTVTDVETPGALPVIQAILSRVFPRDHVVLIQALDDPALPYELAELMSIQLDPNETTHLFVPPLAKLAASRSPHTLQHIVARLRDEAGCPWDRQQSHATLRDAVLDEAYEVLDAIDAGDWENLAEELGDLFLLVAMHSQIAEESGEFTLEDVYEHINTKIVRRHPHVFGDVEANDPDAVVKTWNEVKEHEKAAKPPNRAEEVDGQPRTMPALVRAARVLKKHPLPDGTVNGDPGDAMLRIVSDLVRSGKDPEVVLRDALIRHVERNS